MLDYKFDFSAASELKRYPSTGINVLVAGGGLGGMYAAMNCYQKGHNVTVIESARSYDNNGGFIRLSASIFDSLNNFPGLRDAFDLMSEHTIYTAYTKDGDTVMGPIALPKGGGVSNAGISIHRSSLNRCLYEYVRALGIEVQLDTRIASYFDDGEKGGCVTKTGEKFEADIVIVADGIGSHSADVVFNEESDGSARSSGYAVFRCTFPAEEAWKVPNVENRFRSKTSGTGNMNLWMAHNGYAVIFTTDDVFNFHLVHPDHGDATERWDQKTDKDKVLAFVSDGGWSQDVQDMVKAAPADSLFDWRLMFRNPKPNWISKHGHVVQLGDAAHTFLPSSGNGATQALEDAVCLAACLQLAGKSQIPLAARVYNKLRFERTSCAQKVGFRNRNNWIGAPKADIKERLKNNVGSWITKHNPETYTYENYGKCVNHILMGAPFENSNIPPGHKYVPWTMHDFLNGEADYSNETGDWY